MKLVKSFFTLALLVFGLSFNHANAQQTDVDLTITKVVDLSADAVWTVLRKMDDIDKYSSVIANVKWTGNHGEGGQRECYTPDGQGYFKESIVKFDDLNRRYDYALLEGAPVTGMVNSFKVVDAGYNKSVIVWTSSYDTFVENPQMTEEQFITFANQTINELLTNVIAKAGKKV